MDEVEDGDIDETPCPWGSHDPIELSDSDEALVYVIPFPLEKKTRKVVAPPPDDTDAEDYEIEQRLRGKVTKKAVSGSHNLGNHEKVRWFLVCWLIIDWSWIENRCDHTLPVVSVRTIPSTLFPWKWFDTDIGHWRLSSRPPKASHPSDLPGHDSQMNKNNATSPATQTEVPTSQSSTAINFKRTTAKSNNVVVTHTSVATAPNVKSKSKQLKQVFDAKDNGSASAIEMQDEDNFHEEEMALASPMRGSGARNLSKVIRYILFLI